VSMTLLDWRRRVVGMYAEVRATAERDPVGTADRFRTERDRLFREHPDSPLTLGDRAGFRGIPYWPYDPSMRFEVRVEAPSAVPAATFPVTATSLSGEAFRLERMGRVRLPIGELEVYWIAVYGGGVFLPFRDATSGTETYGAGRYLLDTVKGADLGGSGDRLVLDFNYAYHPSCAYDPTWSCPLAPPVNRLEVPVRVGERL
jgi:uncharacterized protein (DUF1684 family)